MSCPVPPTSGVKLKNTRDVAFIVNAYSYRNAGDAAIMLSTSQVLRDVGYKRILLSTRYLEDAPEYSKANVEVIPSVVAFPTKGTMAESLRSLTFMAGAFTLICALSVPSLLRYNQYYRRALCRLFPRIKMLALGARPVVAGGGYLYSSKRVLNLSLLHSILSIWVCSRLHEDVLCMPSSVGPLDKNIDRILVEYVFKKISVTLRETKSIEASSRRPILAKSELCPDVAFYGHESGAPGLQEDVTRDGPVVRIVAMDWSWSKSVRAGAMEAYVQGLARVGDMLIDKGINVVLGGHSAIPEHGQQDLSVCALIARHMKHVPTIDANCDVYHLAHSYSNVDVVVATRLHAAIMATAAETPTVVLGYQEKARGIVESWLDGTNWFAVDSFDADEVVNSCLSALDSEAKQKAAILSKRLKVQILGVYRDRVPS